MINIGLSPNLTLDDIFLALKLLFQPWRWKKGKAIGELENWFKTNISFKADKQDVQVISFNSGRSAEYEILKAFGLGENDEILLQAFTCVAVPNSVLWTGATPVYVDVDKNLTMDPADLERKITPQSKAVILQHTFGQLAQLEKICQIAKEYHLFVIEDCAHIIKKDIKGDAAFFSFGRDKAVSSVFGGIGVISSKFKEIQQELTYPSLFWIFQQLLHPVAMAVILPLYNLANFGKFVLLGLQKLKLLSFPVYPEEKQGLKPKDFPKRMPNALAKLALAQLDKLEEFEEKRKEISGIYKKELKGLEKKGYLKRVSGFDGLKVSWLRYSLLVEKPEELRKFAKNKGVILGNWYSHVIDPQGTDFQKIGYRKGNCPVAEEIAGQIVNLPTYPRMKKEDAEKVVGIIKEYFSYSPT